MPIPECLKNCGSCPFAKLCHGETTLAASSASVLKEPNIIGKINFKNNRQNFSVSSGFYGRPVAKETGGCKECAGSFLGSCSKHSKPA